MHENPSFTVRVFSLAETDRHTETYNLSDGDVTVALIKPNSITLASSELAPNMFGASSELASLMEFGREPASSC